MTGARDHLPDTTVTPVAHGTNTKDLDTAALDPNPVITATGTAAATIPIGADPDHSIGLCTAISHEIEDPVPTTTVVIHHTTDNPPIGIPPEMTADLAAEPEGNITNHPEDLHGNLKIESTNKSQSTTHHLITIVQMTVIGPQMMI